MIDDAIEKAVMGVFDSLWRRDELAALKIPQVIPLTAGYDEVCPFWRFGKARPADATYLKEKTRPRPAASSETQFTPEDIPGFPGQLGTGYVEIQLIPGGAGGTVQPGSTTRVEEHRIDLLHWLYLPSTRSEELKNPYTSAIKELWRRVHLLRDFFAPMFPGSNLGVHDLWQRDPIPMRAVQQGMSGQFEVLLQSIPIHIRIMVPGDRTVTL